MVPLTVKALTWLDWIVGPALDRSHRDPECRLRSTVISVRRHRALTCHGFPRRVRKVTPKISTFVKAETAPFVIDKRTTYRRRCGHD